MPESAHPDRSTHRDRLDLCREELARPPRFEVRGYGATCTACGSLVVGPDGEEIHRRHHRALAVLGRLDPP